MDSRGDTPKQAVSEEEELEQLQVRLSAPLQETLCQQLSKARHHEKWPIAQLISVFERHTDDNFVARHQIETYMDAHSGSFKSNARIIGITGTPGAGKSSLIGALCKKLLHVRPNLSIAVLAIDPSSQKSGGALLGDRTRTQFPINDKRLFFRSQASHLDLGGMGKSTFHVTRLLKRLFDVVIIETVGIGQSEVEVQRLSDETCLVMQPLAGDQIQFMKAGIMEVPDTFIINKCDEASLAKKSYQLLKASLKLAQIYIDHEDAPNKSIFLTSATRNRGIKELSGHILSELDAQGEKNCHETRQMRERYFLKKWVKETYGDFGLAVYAHFAPTFEASGMSFEEREIAFKSRICEFVNHVH